MAITIDDFSKIWASTSPLTPYSFSDDNYKSGWNFIGSTPPSRQMWDFLQKNNDEKMQYLANNYLPLSGGTMTGGEINYFGTDDRNFRISLSPVSVDIGWNNGNADGSFIAFKSSSFGDNQSGDFLIRAKDSSNSKELRGKPDGTLTWNGKNVLTDAVTIIDNLSSIMSFNSGFALRGGSLHIVGGTFAFLRLGINISKSISANSDEQIGKITNATYRPAVDSYFGGGDDNVATIGANGNINVRFFVAKNNDAWIWVSILYLLV